VPVRVLTLGAEPSDVPTMLPIGEEAAEGFGRLVDACYEKRSLAVSSNLHPAGFDELMPKTLATATVDRLLHHAHVYVTSGTQSCN
jgi:DNA replication protein DnaC